MESGQHQRVDSEANQRRRRKIFMACMHCRDGKVSCDGLSPECSRCVGRGLNCEYRAIRKMRGPGKKSGAQKLEAQLQRTDVVDDGKNGFLNDDIQPIIPKNFPESEDSTGLEGCLRQLYPAFLHPENHIRSLQSLKRAVQEDQKSPEGFAPLIPHDMFQHVLMSTYDEITHACPIFDLSTLNRLNADQQAVSRTHPAGNLARWAILSTWLAIGMRLRTVPGSEGQFTHVVKSYYRNAVLVLPDLILQPENMETIQALVFMAAFAEGMEDHRSFVMLVTNATRQIELLAPRLPGVSDRGKRESWKQLLSFARLQDSKVAEEYGLTPVLKSELFNMSSLR